MLMKTKRYYSKEFKLQAISMAEDRENIAEVARELDIRSDMLRRWIREYKKNTTGAFQGSGHPPKPKDKKLSELQKLKRELKEVKLERDILKKAVHIFSKSDGTNIDL